MTAQSAFDAAASDYDATATNLLVSRWLRERVWARLEALFPPGSHVLELGCGTGEDALWLARRGVHVTATDFSAAMLEQAKAKVDEASRADIHLGTRVRFCQLDLARAEAWDFDSLRPESGFDGAFSNYGPLNCVAPSALPELGRALAGLIRPGGSVGVAVMGRFCAWETLWHASHGGLRTATRRWPGQTTATINNVTFPVYYPNPAQLGRALNADTHRFIRRGLLGLGVFLPPSDVYGALGKRPRLARLLLRAEQLTANLWPFVYVADHYWLELERLR
jgi:SAM-dependent methyltransferase